MTLVTTLAPYSDERGNLITFDGTRKGPVQVEFTGSNNRLHVDAGARLGQLAIQFDCDDGLVEIGPNKGVPNGKFRIRVGQDSTVRIGRNVSCTQIVLISATEGTTVTIGDDVMIATYNEIRADDAHPIFDVRTGLRVNPSEDIQIGDHVWIARSAIVLGGAAIGDGSVVGLGSVVTRPVPNNCIVAGAPARVVRRDVAWERPHLSRTKPYYKPDGDSIRRTQAHWRLTTDDGPETPAEPETPTAPVSPTAPMTTLMRVRRRIASIIAPAHR